MENDVQLSIIIPVYNAEKFIRTAIESVLMQISNKIELILIDDGSEDRSKHICEEYCSENVFCISISHAGTGRARNTGIKRAKGSWIIFLDSDDMILDKVFDYNFFDYLQDKYEQGIDLIHTPRVDIDFELKEKFNIIYPERLEDIKYHMPKMSFFTGIYKREFLIDKNIKFFEYSKQDIETAFRYRAFSKTNNIFIDTNKIFYLHRNNPTSNTNTWRKNEMLEVKAKVYWELFKETDEEELETRSWLYERYLSLTSELIENYRMYGFCNKSSDEREITKIIELFSMADFKQCNISRQIIKYSLQVRLLAKKGIIWRCFLEKSQKEHIKHKQVKKEIKEQKSDNTNYILERLKIYSAQIKNR